MAIHVGETLDPGSWSSGHGVPRGMILRVVAVKHIIFETQGVASHKLCVYTEEMGNDPDNDAP